MNNSIPIPKPLWDALENVLMVKSRELIKDIAKTLNQPDKPLLEAFKSKKQSFHLLDIPDPTNQNFQCEAFVCNSAVAHRCMKPVLFGQKVCPLHEYYTKPNVDGKPVVQRLVTDEGETYFVDSLANVYNQDFLIVGTYMDNILRLYTLEEEEEFA